MKKNIYTTIVNEFRLKGYKVFFKSHPREITTYKFSDDVVKLEKEFPAEILNFINIKFDTIVVISSGSLDTVRAINKIRLYPEFFDTLDYSNMENEIKQRIKNIK